LSALTESWKPNRILVVVKISKSRLRKIAYEYIHQQMGKIHSISIGGNHPQIISLDELRLLKEGLADPSAELVASLKQLLTGSVTEAEIDAHLVKPFHKHKVH
jgi:succinyl-CoA synthetase alpha subunit